MESTAQKPQKLLRCAEWVIRQLRTRAKRARVELCVHNGVPVIYAQTHGAWRKPDVLLQGHIDVVSGNKIDFTPRIVGDRLYGRGAADMKASVAILMSVFAEIAQYTDTPSLGLMLTGDEEIGGANGAEWYVRTKKLTPKLLINLDGGYGEEISYAEKGILYARIQTHGTSSLATYPWNGDCAFEKLSQVQHILKKRFVAQRRATDSDNWVDTCTVLSISGGSPRVKRVMDTAEMTVRIAFTGNYAPEDMLKHLRTRLPLTTITPLLTAERVYTNPRHPSIRRFQKIYAEHLGVSVSLRGENGSSDARFFSQLHIPMIITKPKSGNAEMDNEWVSLKSCEILRKTLLQFIQDKKTTAK